MSDKNSLGCSAPRPPPPVVTVKSQSTGKGWGPSFGVPSDRLPPALTLSERSRHQQRKSLCLPIPPPALEASGKRQNGWHPSPKHCPLQGATRNLNLPHRVNVDPSMSPSILFLSPDVEGIPCNPHASCTPHAPDLSPVSGLCPTPGGRSGEDLDSVLALPTRTLASRPRSWLDQRCRVTYMRVHTHMRTQGCCACCFTLPPQSSRRPWKLGVLLLFVFHPHSRGQASRSFSKQGVWDKAHSSGEGTA